MQIKQMSHNAQFRDINVYTRKFLLQHGTMWDMGLMPCVICD